MTANFVIRTRFAPGVVERLDVLAGALRPIIRKRVPRARLVRVLVGLNLDMPATSPDLAAAIKADPVRQGRMKARRT